MKYDDGRLELLLVYKFRWVLMQCRDVNAGKALSCNWSHAALNGFTANLAIVFIEQPRVVDGTIRETLSGGAIAEQTMVAPRAGRPLEC